MGGRRERFAAQRVALAVLLGPVVLLLALGFEPLTEDPVPSLSYRDLKGDGWLGYRLGYAGTAMLLLAQAYLFRPGLLDRKEWLDVHCYLSAAGGLFVLIHSGFPFSFGYWNPFERVYPRIGLYGLVGLQGLAAWLVVALVVSGLFGRYVSGRAAPWAAFRHWRAIHSALSGALYVSGTLHLLLAVLIKHVTAA